MRARIPHRPSKGTKAGIEARCIELGADYAIAIEASDYLPMVIVQVTGADPLFVECHFQEQIAGITYRFVASSWLKTLAVQIAGRAVRWRRFFKGTFRD